MRYEAQAAPSEGSRGAAEAKTTAWMGAFERVLGDHAEEAAPAEREKRPKPSNDRAYSSIKDDVGSVQAKGLEGDKGSSLLKPADAATTSIPTKSGASTSSASAMPKSSPRRPISKQAKVVGAKEPMNRSEDSDSTYEVHRSVPSSPPSSSSRLAHMTSNRSLRAPPSSSSSTTLMAPPPQLPASKQSIRSYAPDHEEHDEVKYGADNPASGLAKAASGPTLLDVFSRSPDNKVVFDDLYLNHAPGLRPIRLRNTLGPGRSVLVRLESDLGNVVSFMRRKRTAPKNELDKLVWPSNTLAWARGDGLSPAKLRDLRAISNNLEVADSLILEGGAATEVFVILRPSQLPNVKATSRQKVFSRTSSQSSTAGPSPQLKPQQQQQQQQGRSNAPVTSDQRLPVASVAHGAGGPKPASQEATATASSVSNPPSEAHGTLTIRAWAMPSISQASSSAGSGGATLLTADDGYTSGHSSTSSSRPTSVYGGSTLGSSLSTALTEVSDVEPQLIKLPLVARYCSPQLALSARQPASRVDAIDDTRTLSKQHKQGVVVLDFGDVQVGQTVETDLTLLNQSHIDCFWQGKVDCGDEAEASPAVKLLDAQTGTPVETVSSAESATTYLPHVLTACSTLNMKLKLCVDQPDADFEELVSFTNLHNTANALRVLVRANVLPSGHEGALVVAPADVLDFGDCCGGHWTRQLLILRNVVNHSLDIALSAQKGFEVTMQLAPQVPESDEAGTGESAGEEILVGATAASSGDGSGSGTSEASSGASSGALSPGARYSPAPSAEEASSCNVHNSIALELARTPTHHASLNPAMEPPTFNLGSPRLVEDLEKTPMTLGPIAHPPAPKHQAEESNEGDDEDRDSVASQAGSRPGSPTPAESLISRLDTGSKSPNPSSRAPSQMGEKTTTAHASDKAHSVLAWRDASEASEVSSASGEAASLTRSVSGSVSATSQSWKAVSSAGRRDEEEWSVKSESSNYSQESRSAGPSSMSKSVASGTRHSPSLPSRVGGTTAFSGSLRTADQGGQDKNLESLSLRPGEEVRIVVSFRPSKGELDDTFSAGRLTETTFRITLDYVRARSNVTAGGGSRLRGGRERKTVLCRTRTCTSFVTVEPKELDFGEVSVGSRKTSQIAVTNRSDLSARVDLRFVSKVLSMYRDEIAVPAGQTIHLSIDYSPRRVNTAYSKQITIANLLNRRNDQIVEVRGKNVDKQRISFHSLFYRILTPDGSNFLEFGDVNINSSRVRTFMIENVSKTNLVLDITTANTEDLSLYTKAMPRDDKVSATSQASSAGNDGSTQRASTDGYEDSEPAQSVATRFNEDDLASKIDKAKGAELKEKFLEHISLDAPANVRQENTFWRTAQKLSHFRKDAAATSALGQSKEVQPASSTTKAKQQVNMLSALKKGGRGKITMQYRKSMTFKDRSLIQSFEYLDLATGPPLVAKRISVKSKCFQLLEQLEAAKGRAAVSLVASDDKTVTAAGLKAPSNPSGRSETAKTSQDPVVQPPKTPVRGKGLPAPVAEEIKLKAGTPSRSVSLEATSKDRSPALTGKKKAKEVVLDPSDVSNLTLDGLLPALEAQATSLSTLFFNSAQAEERHVRLEINLQRELRKAIETKQLVPIGLFKVPPGQERQVVAVYCPNGSTRPHIQGTARKQDFRIFLRPVEYDVEAVRSSSEFREMADLDKDELPIRDLMIRTTTCRSLLESGQPHINFGQMEKGETKTRKILIHNRSEWTARYCIRKSGSIASGDIKLASGRYGIVPAHGKREVEFIFSPSLTGPFQEKLVIENVADRDRDLTVSLKASVRKKPNFTVEPTTIDLGDCLLGRLTDASSFTISNTTSKSRTFVIAVDVAELRQGRTVTDLVISSSSDADSRATLSKAEETSIAEELEHISQKLKIATRKGQEDKIKKYEGRLAELNGKNGSSPVSGPPGDGASIPSQPATPSVLSPRLDGFPTDSDKADVDKVESKRPDGDNKQIPPLTTSTTNDEPLSTSSRLKRVSSTIPLTLSANQSRRISVQIRTSWVEPSDMPQGDVQDVLLNVQCHEVKNLDEMKVVQVKARMLLGKEAVPGVMKVEADELPVDDGSNIVVFTSDMQT